jgi:uncharacterized protein
MDKHNHPTSANGKICYIEIPTDDIILSSSFYHEVFGWKTRTRSDGSIAFDDTVNEVSGSWVTGRKTGSEVNILIYIMVDDINNTVKKIISNGGKIVQEIGKDAPEITARFSDPFGNIFGIYQEPVQIK